MHGRNRGNHRRPNKTGLVYIGTPKHLRDFLWYYAAGHGDIAYSCISAASPSDDSLYQACLRSGVFQKVAGVPNLSQLKLIDLFFINAGILLSCLTGTKRHFAEGLLLKCIREPGKWRVPSGGRRVRLSISHSGQGGRPFVSSASVLICPCNYGLLPGLMVFLSKYKRVIQLEEGMAEYTEKSRNHRPSLKEAFRHPGLLYFWLLSKTGFTDCTMKMGTPGDRYCVKYVSCPALLKYRNFKEIRQLYVFKGNVRKIYLQLAAKTFSLDALPPEIDLIIFTAALSDFSLDEAGCVQRMCKCLSKRFPGVRALLKRHPRDHFKEYDFPGMEIAEADSEIPGELLIHKYPHIPVATFNMSTLLLEAALQHSPILIFHIKGINPEKGRNAHYIDIFESGMEMLSKVGCGQAEIIDI